MEIRGSKKVVPFLSVALYVCLSLLDMMSEMCYVCFYWSYKTNADST